jgi:diguanylate cyclase (GGDEF)-like protein
MRAVEIEKKIEEELLNALYRDLRFSLIASLFAVFVFVYGMGVNGTPTNQLAGWSAVMIFVTFIRFLEIKHYGEEKEKTGHIDITKWKKHFRISLTFSSMIWAIGIFILFPENSPLYQAYVIFIAAGITAGGVNSLSADRISSIIFPSSILLALFFRLTMESERIFFLEALMTIVYLILLIYIAQRFHHNQKETLRNYFHIQETSDRLSESQNRLTFLFDSVPAGIFYYDTMYRLLEGNRLFYTFMNLREDDKTKIGLESVAPSEMIPILKQAIAHPDSLCEGDLKLRIEPVPLWVHLQTKALLNPKGEIIGGAGILTDITDHIRAMEAIRHRANYDQLTNLPNRSFFLEKLSASLKSMEHKLSTLALLFMDIDNFKEINDTYGHSIGDRILIEVSRRLKHRLRWKDVIARFGGDEFVILLQDLPADMETARQNCKTITDNLLSAVKEPVVIGDKHIKVGLSIGVTLTVDSHQRAETLLTEADQAMYNAKESGKNRAVFYEERISSSLES